MLIQYIDEIEKDKAANGDVSPETWRTTLIEKYDNLMRSHR